MQPQSLSRRGFMELLAATTAGAALVPAPASRATAQAIGAVPSAAPSAARTSHATTNTFKVQYEPLATYDVDRLNKILTTELAEFSDFKITYPPAKNAVQLYRVTYPSVVPELGNKPTTASGLIAVPVDASGKLPVVSYQHGSVFGKDEVPSNPEQSAETRLMLANFGGQGYMVIAADYFGKGISTEANSYIVKASTQQACLDMLFAAQALAPDLGVELGSLFVSGWSQGGWSAFTFLDKLESVGIPVTAAAVPSGPVDLYATVNRWANNWQQIDAVYIPPLVSIMVNAFEQYYALPGLANSAIKPEYQEPTRQLYFNEIPYEDALKQLPAKLPDMLNDDFRAAIARGESRFSRLLQESHAYRWRSVTPARVYYGGIDEVTPVFIGTMPVGYQKAIGGAEVTAVDAGAQADHRGTFLYSIADQKKWFDQLLE